MTAQEELELYVARNNLTEQDLEYLSGLLKKAAQEERKDVKEILHKIKGAVATGELPSKDPILAAQRRAGVMMLEEVLLVL